MTEQQEKHENKKRSGLSLLAVQSVVCAVVLLLALILRLINGSFYTDLRTWFENALMDNGFAQTIAEQLSDTRAA